MTPPTEIPNEHEFNAAVAVYATADYWREDEESLITRFCTRKKAKLLIIGCGGGRTIGHLKNKGFDITAIDIASEMVEAALLRFPDVAISKQDACATSFPSNTFDYIVMPFHVLGDIYNPSRALLEAHRVLKFGGILIANAPNQYYLKGILHGNLFKPRRRRGKISRTSDQTIEVEHFTFLDTRRFRKLFRHVQWFGRSSLHVSPAANWKETALRILPWFDKSLYFVLTK